MKIRNQLFYILIITLFLKSNGYSQDLNNIDNARLITSGGYSIFHETMVDMPWTEVEKSINNGAIVLLPIGVVEEHGPHMTCGPDIYQSYLSAKIIRRELDSIGIKTLIAPPFYWGIADIASCFPGTFTVREETMKLLLKDIFTSLEKWGVKHVVLLDGHGESKHLEVMRKTIVEYNKTSNMRAFFFVDRVYINKYQSEEFKNYVIPVTYKPEIKIDCRYDNQHADCKETGNMAGFFPELVDTSLARTLLPTDFRDRSEFKSPADVGKAWENDARSVTPQGYFGDPASFDIEKSIINYINNSKSEAEAIEIFFKDK